jgi:hypothetical protein
MDSFFSDRRTRLEPIGPLPLHAGVGGQVYIIVGKGGVD